MLSGSNKVAGASLMESFMGLSKAEPRRVIPVRMAKDVDEKPEVGMTLEKSILNLLNGTKGDSVERLAFETDPNLLNVYAGVYRMKLRLLPDSLLKRIIIQDDLVASIIRARETQMASFGRPRPDRFSTGFEIIANTGVINKCTPEQKAELNERIQLATKAFWTCGSTEGRPEAERVSFSQYLQMTTRNAVGLGRLATEIVYRKRLMSSEKEFAYFRPADAGTMFKATNQKSAAQAVRDSAIKVLAELTGKKQTQIDQDRFEKDDFAWIQVIEGRPVQAFTAKEMRIHNFYPVVDVELDGYPVTPIDTMISNVTTHINITTHNKLYFQSGRAARGMLVFKSDDVDEAALQRIKQQFNASINSVSNSWRMPVFSCGSGDEISWSSIDSTSRDAEFQYLLDMNARVILSAFQMSPDELPGWSYLSRGTNNQSMSEADNEYRLEAARDQGIRPLLSGFEDFINSVLFPLIDEKLSKLCHLKLTGLDANSKAKEAIDIQTMAPLHGTMDDILQLVEKQPMGKDMGGTMLLNPQYQAILDKMEYVDVIKTRFFGTPPDPALHYIRDPFYFQNLQMQMQAQQMQQQAQQGQPAPGGGDAGGGAPDGGGGNPSEAPQPGGVGDQPGAAAAPTDGEQGQPGGPQETGEDLSRSIDQALSVLSKSEGGLPLSKRKLLVQARLTVDKFRTGMENEIREATKSILEVAEKHK